MSPEVVNLLSGMLKTEAGERLSATSCLSHPWLQDMLQSDEL